jgi:hypothetical protein
LGPWERGGALQEVSVSGIHAYPLRPPGFEEPLFPTPSSRKAVAEHLLEAPWLRRASGLEGRAGEAARSLAEPVELRNLRGRVELIRVGGGGRCSWRRRRVAEVLDRWREIGEWWDENRRRDRLVFRVLLCGGAVVDLARERSGGWLLIGVVD